MHKLRLALFALLLASTTFAAETSGPAPDGVGHPVVSLSARASRSVQNDTASASLFVEREDNDAAKAEEAVTQQLNQAHALLKTFSALKVRTASHQAYPVWDKNRITRWRVRHELLVEGADFAALSRAIGAVQSHMQLGGIQFSVSARLREATENELIQQAAAAFQRRAELVSQSFGARRYRIKELAVQSSEPIHVAPMLRAQAVMAPAEATPPTLEGGSNEIGLTVSGTIELTLP